MRLVLGTVAAVLIIAACGGGAGASRAPRSLMGCLRATGQIPERVGRNSTLLDTLRFVQRPQWLIDAGSDPGVIVARYRSERAARGVFAGLEETLPVIRQGSTLLVMLLSPQPSVAAMGGVERCALGRPASATVGGLVTDVPFSTPRHQRRCRLAASFGGGTGGAGVWSAGFGIRNVGARPCALYRYPRVAIVGPTGRIEWRARPGSGGAIPVVAFVRSLAPGQTVTFGLVYELSVLLYDSPCHGQPGAAALITIGPDATARASLIPPPNTDRQPGECPGGTVSALGANG
jgi:hypothetical protein